MADKRAVLYLITENDFIKCGLVTLLDIMD
jgi:hypothetical protein